MELGMGQLANGVQQHIRSVHTDHDFILIIIKITQLGMLAEAVFRGQGVIQSAIGGDNRIPAGIGAFRGFLLGHSCPDTGLIHHPSGFIRIPVKYIRHFDFFAHNFLLADIAGSIFVEKLILPLVCSITKLFRLCNRLIAQKTRKPNENYRWVLAILTKWEETPLPCLF
jgi:hypothetical protein